MKGQQLSPRKYIETKARSLPIGKCFVNTGWEEARLAEVIVTRRHTNGHQTAGIYLVDLLCLGIKDTFYLFNEDEDVFSEKIGLDNGTWKEIDYNLAHNIIFAGHDFALDYTIYPHKKFQTTKYILDEDSDAIPLIEIATGDKNGNPHLMVSATYLYKPVLEKLEKTAGKENYTFSIKTENDEDADDNLLEEEEEWSLDEIEPDLLQFADVKYASGEELEAAYNDEKRTFLDKSIITVELILRTFSEFDPDWDKTVEEIEETEDFQSYQNALENDSEADERMKNAVNRISLLVGANLEKTQRDKEDHAQLFSAFTENVPDELVAFLILNLFPVEIVEDQWETMRQQFAFYPPLVQLAIGCYAHALPLPAAEELTENMLANETVEDAFPTHTSIGYLHHILFWMAKVIHAIKESDEKKIQHFHSLLRMTEMPPGNLKLLYAVTFSNWLAKEIKHKMKEEN